MRIVELSLPIDAFQKKGHTKSIFSFNVKEVPLKSNDIKYTGVIYDFQIDSMAGTYIDLPGHIKETDDGAELSSFPPEKLYRLNTVAIHLDRSEGGVDAKELASAGKSDISKADAVIINGFGSSYVEESKSRKLFLTKDAVEWLIGANVKLVVSDIYESNALHGVFYYLFSAGISTVCNPVNLHLVGDSCRLSIFPLPLKGITQAPCRVIAEIL